MSTQPARPRPGKPRSAAKPAVRGTVVAVRRRLPRDERHVEILKAATRVFYAKGFEAASMQDIAAAMGIKKASLYYYFSSKGDLLHAVLARIIGLGMQNVRAISAQGGDPLSLLWRLVAGHVHHLCANLVETTVFLHERKRIPLERRREILGDDYAYQMAFIDTITKGQAAGQIRADVDPKVVALSILGSINWIYTWFRPEGDLDADDVGAQFATMTINSVASDDALRTWAQPERSALAPASGQRIPAFGKT